MTKRNYFIIAILCCSIGLQSQYPAALVDYQTEISLKKGKLKRKVTKLLQINHSDADDYTDTGIYFSKGDELKIHTVRIEDIRGKVLRELNKKEIKTQSSVARGALYTDDFVKFFKPKWHEYPYRIYFEYTHIVEDFLFLTRWSPITQSDVPTISASLEISLPTDFPINMNFPDSINFSEQVSGKEKVYKWKAENMLPPRLNNYGPPLRSILPEVLVFPQKFKYGLEGSQKTWNDYGQWQYRMNQGLRELPSAEKAKIDELIAGLTDQREIVNTLYKYLQENHRYILVSIETGGLKPYPASYVCEKRYGDCKALTNFMQAMLDYVNIPSFYVKVYAGSNPVSLKTEIPGQQFNHVILGVSLQGDTLWLENTSNSYPPDYLGTFTQNRKALLVHPQHSRLINLPSLKTEKPTEKSIYTYFLDETGNGNLTIETTATNQDFESLNYYRKNTTATKIKKRINRYYPLKNTTLVDYEFSQPDAAKPELLLKTNWTTKRQFQKIGNRVVFSPLPFTDFELEKPEDRTQPLVFKYPTFESFEVNYQIENFGKFQIEIPEPIKIEMPFGTLSVSASVIDGMIKIKQVRTIKAGKYSLETYPDIYNFIRETEQVYKKFLTVCTPNRKQDLKGN